MFDRAFRRHYYRSAILGAHSVAIWRFHRLRDLQSDRRDSDYHYRQVQRRDDPGLQHQH